MSIFVTGTDTGVGKTSFTVWLLQSLRERGIRCAGYKPICCGDRDDAVQLQAAGSPGPTIDDVNPVWLQTPAAPLTAARVEKREIDLPSLREGFLRLNARVDFVAVEGVGGWMVPITPDYFSNHLAAELALPVIVVALNRLGCLNHVLLTARAIESAGLKCAGRRFERLRSGIRYRHGNQRRNPAKLPSGADRDRLWSGRGRGSRPFSPDDTGTQPITVSRLTARRDSCVTDRYTKMRSWRGSP